MLEFDVTHEFVFVNDLLDVALNFWARGIEGRPVGLNKPLALSRQRQTRKITYIRFECELILKSC